jgi:hypothetical protein
MKDFSVIRREIEEHFERCIHALEVRRHSLINQLEQMAVQQGFTLPPSCSFHSSPLFISKYSIYFS